jgi:hypothetical protein
VSWFILAWKSNAKTTPGLMMPEVLAATTTLNGLSDEGGSPLNSVRTSRALGGCPPDSANVPGESRARGIAARLIKDADSLSPKGCYKVHLTVFGMCLIAARCRMVLRRRLMISSQQVSGSAYCCRSESTLLSSASCSAREAAECRGNHPGEVLSQIPMNWQGLELAFVDGQGHGRVVEVVSGCQ